MSLFFWCQVVALPVFEAGSHDRRVKGVSYEEGSAWKDLNIVMVFLAFKNADQVCCPSLPNTL